MTGYTKPLRTVCKCGHFEAKEKGEFEYNAGMEVISCCKCRNEEEPQEDSSDINSQED